MMVLFYRACVTAGVAALVLLSSKPLSFSRGKTTRAQGAVFEGVQLGNKLIGGEVNGQLALVSFLRTFVSFAARKMGVSKGALVNLSFEAPGKDLQGNTPRGKNLSLGEGKKHVATVRVKGGKTMKSCKAGPVSIEPYRDGGGDKDTVHYVITWNLGKLVQISGKVLPFLTFRLICVAMVVFIIMNTKGKTTITVSNFHKKEAPLWARFMERLPEQSLHHAQGEADMLFLRVVCDQT
ncbi:MAG: hypothetical protein GY740_04335 [Gammaproteobacteria bacterium]|nr:hypothetical protein [Gammaproteobacteria bacterium]